MELGHDLLSDDRRGNFPFSSASRRSRSISSMNSRCFHLMLRLLARLEHAHRTLSRLKKLTPPVLLMIMIGTFFNVLICREAPAAG